MTDRRPFNVLRRDPNHRPAETPRDIESEILTIEPIGIEIETFARAVQSVEYAYPCPPKAILGWKTSLELEHFYPGAVDSLCEATVDPTVEHRIAAFPKEIDYCIGRPLPKEATWEPEGAAKLAGAADDLALALVRLEQTGVDFRCAYCKATSNPEEGPVHRPGCILFAALHKAGLR